MRRILVSSVLLFLVAAAPALAGDAVPFKGVWSGSTISAVPLTPDQVMVVASGSGHATIVGKFVMTAPHISFLSTGAVEGTQVFVAANGDALYATFSGALAPNAEGNLEGVLPATITGGTGRVAHATGSYAFHIVARPAAFGFDSTASIDGTIVVSR
ncbi:MAG TPA: hypothetical protein VFA27_16675 [Vicinamibacterales bacterium]|nr:hypothetical protein [Vicinamibacterales bacterium]